MLFILKSYLNFLWNSKNEHGVHSPFVFDLVTKCFYDTKKYTEYSILKEYRKSLLKNKNYIGVFEYQGKKEKNDIVIEIEPIVSRYMWNKVNLKK